MGALDTGCVAVSVSDDGQLPKLFSLDQNVPNPFNPSTTINYRLERAGTVRLEVININGRLIRTLVDDTQKAGDHKITWDGRNNEGQTVAVGPGNIVKNCEYINYRL